MLVRDRITWFKLHWRNNYDVSSPSPATYSVSIRRPVTGGISLWRSRLLSGPSDRWPPAGTITSAQRRQRYRHSLVGIPNKTGFQTKQVESLQLSAEREFSQLKLHLRPPFWGSRGLYSTHKNKSLWRTILG